MNQIYRKGLLVWLVFCTALFGCQSAPEINATGTPPATTFLATSNSTEAPPQPQVTQPASLPSASPSSTDSVTPTLTPSKTAAPTITSTPDPYEPYTIEALSQRSYGGGSVEIEQILAVNSYFTRTLISYPSDDLTIYGFMNVPQGTGPFPVVLALHGYIDPDVYLTLDYTTGYADTLARAGYLVLHPNLRGYPPSDSGDNLFRVGMAIDTLNLVALVQQTGGQPGSLLRADPESIGLWGHSMGGGISTRVMTVNPNIKAVALYAATSGEERQNYEAIIVWTSGEIGSAELSAPPDVYAPISPVTYFDRIQAAVTIHHGRSDEIVPLRWSIETCTLLQTLGKTVECFYYPGELHTFSPEGGDLFMNRVISFFNKYLK